MYTIDYTIYMSNSQCELHAPLVEHGNILVGHAVFWWSMQYFGGVCLETKLMDF